MINEQEAYSRYDDCVAAHHPMQIEPVRNWLLVDGLVSHWCMVCDMTYIFNEEHELMMITSSDGITEKSQKT